MLIFEKVAAMMAMSTCLLDLKKKVALIKTERELLAKCNVELLASAIWKGAKSIYKGNSFMETFSPMYLGFPLHVKNSIVPYCLNEFLSSFLLL